MPFIEKGKLGGESALREEIKNPLWDMVRLEHIQTLKRNNSRLSEKPWGSRAGDGCGLTPRPAARKPDMCGLRPPWRLYQVLAQHTGSGPACLLTRLLPALIGTSATSQVLPLQRQEGPEEGSVLLNTRRDTWP